MKKIVARKYSQIVYDYVNKLYTEEGLTQVQICERLNAEGWVNRDGGKIIQPVLSRFMKSRGHKGFYGNRKKKSIPADSALRDIEDIYKTEISAERKLKFIGFILQSLKAS